MQSKSVELTLVGSVVGHLEVLTDRNTGVFQGFFFSQVFCSTVFGKSTDVIRVEK